MTSLCDSLYLLSAVNSHISETIDDLFYNFALTYLRAVLL